MTSPGSGGEYWHKSNWKQERHEGQTTGCEVVRFHRETLRIFEGSSIENIEYLSVRCGNWHYPGPRGSLGCIYSSPPVSSQLSGNEVIESQCQVTSWYHNNAMWCATAWNLNSACYYSNLPEQTELSRPGRTVCKHCRVLTRRGRLGQL